MFDSRFFIFFLAVVIVVPSIGYSQSKAHSQKSCPEIADRLNRWMPTEGISEVKEESRVFVQRARHFPCPDGNDCAISTTFSCGGGHGHICILVWAFNKEGICKIVWEGDAYLRQLEDILVEGKGIFLPHEVVPKGCDLEPCIGAILRRHTVSGTFEKGYKLRGPSGSIGFEELFIHFFAKRASQETLSRSMFHEILFEKEYKLVPPSTIKETKNPKTDVKND